MLRKIFLAHPASVDESYFGHMRFALGFALTLFEAGGAALIHALVPCLCERTASDAVRRLHARVAHRGPGSGGDIAVAPVVKCDHQVEHHRA